MAGTHIRIVKGRSYVVKNPTRRKRNVKPKEADGSFRHPAFTQADVDRENLAAVRRSGPRAPSIESQLAAANDPRRRHSRNLPSAPTPSSATRMPVGRDATTNDVTPRQAAIKKAKPGPSPGQRHGEQMRRSVRAERQRTPAFTVREPRVGETGGPASTRTTLKIWERSDGTVVKKIRHFELIRMSGSAMIVSGRRAAGTSFEIRLPDGKTVTASTLADAKERVRELTGQQFRAARKKRQS